MSQGCTRLQLANKVRNTAMRLALIHYSISVCQFLTSNQHFTEELSPAARHGGTPRMMLRSSCTPSTPLTGSKGDCHRGPAVRGGHLLHDVNGRQARRPVLRQQGHLLQTWDTAHTMCQPDRMYDKTSMAFFLHPSGATAAAACGNAGILVTTAKYEERSIPYAHHLVQGEVATEVDAGDDHPLRRGPNHLLQLLHDQLL